MMRIAIAGTCGLAQMIAHYVQEQTSHQLVLFSREANQQLADRGFEVLVVDYDDAQSLHYALKGVDTVISTVTGQPQINLIVAAANNRVRRFAPAEFEGSPGLRPENDPLDRGKAQAWQLLQQWRNWIPESCVFTCGVLYERFAPGGLKECHISRNSEIAGEGDYILNLRNMTADVPWCDDQGNYACIGMTAASDVGRFVVRALDMPQWPTELRMCGDRMAVHELLALAQVVRGAQFNPAQMRTTSQLRQEIPYAQYAGDTARQLRLHTLIATSEGRYDVTEPNLNALFPDIQPLKFREWLTTYWGPMT
ncbi:hypothetical protein BDY21DRAFT_8836 [Lineolata rhizophorae]|uniref:NmrA-like domain-containing protein n=1 Tax=Lineolata rhizophorae TaxID=578093 RepID=A0A6A6PDW1_9PEZI|nr:hypothetical protein BDY21DRAFT_8836 [Lineolata rhizophorae]